MAAARLQLVDCDDLRPVPRRSLVNDAGSLSLGNSTS